MFELLKIIEKLRSPDGCPWDRKQTHSTLKRFLIEESYETIEAIDSNNKNLLKEELGDVLLQVLLHSQIAKEEGFFSFDDVVKTLSEKLINRHPHVFGEDDKLKTAEEVEKTWEKQKNKDSILDGIPRSMPALLQIYRISERAARLGFDWRNIEEVLLKVEEELQELKDAIKTNEIKDINKELGDLIFASVQVARFLKQPIDDIMSKSITKFINRFQKLEKYLRTKNVKLDNLSFEELNDYWDYIKKQK